MAVITVRSAECGVRSWCLHSAFRIPHSALKNGQSLIEYAVLTAIVAAALGAMSIYAKRALSGNWRSVADTFGSGRQYEPQPSTTPLFGSVWDETEKGYEGGPWRGVWTWTGSFGGLGGGIFIGAWTRLGNNPVRATLEIIIRGTDRGTDVEVRRTGSTDGNDCTYYGTLQGNTVTGTYYVCTNECREDERLRRGPCTWRATIR